MLSRFKFALWIAVAAVSFAGSPVRAEAPGTIVDVAAGAPQFKTLVTALKAAGLVGTLSGKGPFTVFAPTDDAFAKLPAGTVETLLKPENQSKLRAILLYHVVEGSVKSTDLKDGDVMTADGKSVKVDLSGGAPKINEASVTKADIPASNGVIHAIDTVLIPPGS